MLFLKRYVIVSLWTLPNIFCEKWYSAAYVSKDSHAIRQKEPQDQDKKVFDEPNYAPFISSYHDDNEHFYQKLSVTTVQPSFQSLGKFKYNQTTKLNTPDIHGSAEMYVDYYTMRNNSTKPVEVIHYNNTINVVNVIKRTRPKRKIIKRRCPTIKPRQDMKLGSKAAKARFLEVFQVVEFEHVACTSSSGLEGTCLHEYECESSGGSTMGTCADGYGTCCVILFPCDGQSSEPVGWFTSPGFPTPSSERLSCTFTLNKASDDIKQIRLDFVTFELLGPNGGTCQQDQFIVSGHNLNSVMPIFCGINTGQHVYVEMGDVDGPIYLSVQTVSPENRLYSVKVSQLTWADELAAPTGCLQYFTEPQGYLESFNYRDKSEIGIVRIPTYLNNLNYAICIRRAPETCSVTYTNADYMQIVNYDLDGLPIIPQGQAGVEIFNCPSDWILISATRLCGERLNDGSILQDFSLDAPVTDSNAGPIILWFRSDEGYVGRGFKLQYLQNGCNGPD